MSTVKDILKGSLQTIGVVGIGVTPAAHLYDHALKKMNLMLSAWSSGTQGIYYMSREELTLVVGQSVYSIGSGGDFNTARPIEIRDSFIKVNDTEYPVRVIPWNKYNRIPEKTIQGIPRNVYYEPTMTTGTLYFYFVPDSAYTFTLISMKPLPTYLVTDSFALPPGYELAIEYNLPVLLAPSYGKILTPEVIGIASSSYKTIRNTNLAGRIPLMKGLDPTRTVTGQVSTSELFST